MTNNPLIKICGITEKSIAKFLVKNNVDMIGFIFYPPSPRFISLENVKKIIKTIRKSNIKTVGVFVNEDINTVIHFYNQLKLDYIQLHGTESTEYIQFLQDIDVIKAIQIQDRTKQQDILKYADLKQVKYILVDTYKKKQFGGTGETFNWKQHEYLKEMNNVIISGGLNIDNIIAAKNYFQPAGFDINSGVEKAPGIKNKHKIKKILKLIREER